MYNCDNVTITPSTFSGVYTPIFAGPALSSFLSSNPLGFGTVNPKSENAQDLLMKRLPLASSGLLLRNTATMLFYIYSHVNNLEDPSNTQIIKPNELFISTFNGSIPASFYSYSDTIGSRSKVVKIPMDKAVSDGIISEPLSTFDVIKRRYPDFNGERFKSYYFQNITALNYFTASNLADNKSMAEAYDSLQSEEVRKGMLEEHKIVKEVCEEWIEKLKPLRREQRKARKNTNTN